MDQRVRDLSSYMMSLRDKLRVQMDLASKETKESLEDVKPFIDDLIRRSEEVRQRLDSKADEAELQAYLGLREFADKVEVFAGRFENLINEAGSIEDKAKIELEATKLKAEMAKMETEDMVASKRQQFKDMLKTNKTEAVDNIHKTLDSVNKKITQFIDRL
jgi:NAD(P)-dependent dehydrogenase (short-subunit alcohol dehydrogenase family)